MRARSRARLPPTPPSQRLDGGVGGSLQTWSNGGGGRGGRWEKGQKGGNRVSSSGRGEGSIEEGRWVRRGWKEARGEHDGAGNADVHRASHGEEGRRDVENDRI